MTKRSETGRAGENVTALYLEKHGYTILSRNYRIKGGEIDIIARNDFYIVFTEVKTRKPDSLTSGFEAVNKRKKGLIIKTAADYLMKNPSDLQPRFDVAEVIAENGKVCRINYIKNAFDTTGYNIIF